MGQNEQILNTMQLGFEANPGTAVAATRKMYATADPPNGVNVPLVWFPDATGTYQSRRRAAKGRMTVGFPITDLATFEDLHWWLYMMISGEPNEDTGTDPDVLIHEFLPDLDEDTLKSATMEWGDPGNAYEIAQLFLNRWTLRGDTDNQNELGWMLEMDAIARTFEPTTFTAALPDRDTEVITARGTTCTIDDDWASIGTTPLGGRLISWSITGMINRHTKAFSEDEFLVAQGLTGREGWTVDAQLTMEFPDDNEFEHYRSSDPVQRVIRLLREGSEIATGENKALTVDLGGYWATVGTGNRQGNKTITLGLQAGYDVSESTDMRVELINDQEPLIA